MTRNTADAKIFRLEGRVDDLARALGSQVTIIEQLRSDHDFAMARIADSLRTDGGPDRTLSAVLASLEPARPE